MYSGFGYDQTGNTCTCYDATDCNSAISSSSCSVIKLDANINGTIDFSGVSNKILNGQGHSISGSNYGILFVDISTNTNIATKACEDLNNTRIKGKYFRIFIK